MSSGSRTLLFTLARLAQLLMSLKLPAQGLSFQTPNQTQTEAKFVLHTDTANYFEAVNWRVIEGVVKPRGNSHFHSVSPSVLGPGSSSIPRALQSIFDPAGGSDNLDIRCFAWESLGFWFRIVLTWIRGCLDFGRSLSFSLSVVEVCCDCI